MANQSMCKLPWEKTDDVREIDLSRARYSSLFQRWQEIYERQRHLQESFEMKRFLQEEMDIVKEIQRFMVERMDIAKRTQRFAVLVVVAVRGSGLASGNAGVGFNGSAAGRQRHSLQEKYRNTMMATLRLEMKQTQDDFEMLQNLRTTKEERAHKIAALTTWQKKMENDGLGIREATGSLVVALQETECEIVGARVTAISSEVFQNQPFENVCTVVAGCIPGHRWIRFLRTKLGLTRAEVDAWKNNCKNMLTPANCQKM